MSIATLIITIRKKDWRYITFAVMALLLDFSLTILLDIIFISSTEFGEKGNQWIYEKYPTWRIIER